MRGFYASHYLAYIERAQRVISNHLLTMLIFLLETLYYGGHMMSGLKRPINFGRVPPPIH